MRLFAGQRAWVVQRISASSSTALIVLGVLALPFAPPAKARHPAACWAGR